MMTSVIKDRYDQVLERIARAALASGRKPEDVKLVVVTKTQPVEVVECVVEAGARYLGENYAEQAVPKILSLSSRAKVEWHMIGHVQSRKVKIICEHFDYLHSLDSLKLASQLEHVAAEKGKSLPVLLEFNLGAEESKFGWQVKDAQDFEKLLPEFRQILELPHLQVRGLMGMAPLVDEAEEARPFYRHLRLFQDFLRAHLPEAGWSELSMGMSADFEVAVQEGATWVRIGQSILGPRHI